MRGSLKVIVLEPTSTPGRYAAMLDGEELCRSRQPFYEAARTLRDRGVDGATRLEARHEGSAIVAMRSTVGEAATWTVTERDRGGLRKERWQPRDADAWSDAA